MSNLQNLIFVLAIKITIAILPLDIFSIKIELFGIFFFCYVYQEDTPHSITPLIFSNKLTRLLGKGDVYLKLDNLQPSGSFKIRGIGQTCLQAKKSGATTIVGSSGGNAGKAMAYAAKKLNLKAVLFIPTSTPQMMIEKIKVRSRNYIRI